MALTEQPADSVSDITDDDLKSLADQTKGEQRPDPELATWVMDKVTRWRLSRDNNYADMWEKYYRIWRGKWDPSLKGKVAERSRLITPVTQSAVDQTVAEMAEAVFGRGLWFDLSEEQDDPKLQAATEQIRDNLIDDFDSSRLKADVIETFYNGAVFGEGIAKRVIDEAIDGTKSVSWEPVNPNSFVIDTSATSIDEALGVAHETIRPSHEILDKQDSGEYYDDEVIESASGFGATDLLKGGLTDFLEIDPQDGVYITEWHGKVPTRFLIRKPKEEKDDIDLLVDDAAEQDGHEEPEYTEAVVVIANGTHLLKAEKNELNDRGFIAYQHHRAPNQFWGIGVAEKAFNSQVGLDGEVRARADALSLTTYPTVGVDATRMPRNLSMQVGPGKVYMTNGRPSEVIEPIVFGNLNNSSFQQSGDLERYIQLATGATDPVKPVNANQTASGQSQQSSAYIKRAKLTMQAVDVDFLAPMIRKSIIAYNALDPKRYPHVPTFTVNSTMSIMAREFEQMQMTNLLAIIPQESPAFPVILKGIIENYSGPSKDKIIQAIDQATKPDPAAVQAQQQTQQLTLQKLQGEVAKVMAEVDEIKSRGALNGAKAQGESVKAKLAPIQAQIEAKQADVSSRQVDVSNKQVEVSAAKLQIDHHHKNIDHIHRKVENLIAHKKAVQTPAQRAAA